MAESITRDRLLETGAHFGHTSRKWDPKMKEFIYIEKNGVYIIDLNKTMIKLEEALAFVRQLTSSGKKILFVGTKKQSQDIIKEQALLSGSYYVNQRWLGGTLTNINTIQRSVKTLWNIERREMSGELELLTKKEQIIIKKKRDKLLKFLDGIRNMRHLPGAVFVVDTNVEHNAIKEAQKLNIPVIAICDTNSNPDGIKYVIPANDDAKKTITLITTLIAQAVVESLGEKINAVDAKTEVSTENKEVVAQNNEEVKEDK